MHSWSDIKKGFGDTIILGNGASIAISDIYSYARIYNRAIEETHLEGEDKRLFAEYETTNFEQILRALRHALKVNRAMMIGKEGISLIERRITSIKKALKNTILDSHVERREVKPYFSRIANFLFSFDRVFSLNYDLIVYWALLWAHNETVHRNRRMEDCFSLGGESNSLTFDHKLSQRKAPGEVTRVFYPHGNFALAKRREGESYVEEVKLKSHGSQTGLLKSIVREWMSDQYDPLIVSEGSTYQKQSVISSSEYLRTVVFDLLPKVRESVVFYGFSFGAGDQHIIDSVLSHPADVERVAVAVHADGKSDHEVREYRREVGATLRSTYAKNGGEPDDLGVYFFNSMSDGAWIYRNRQAQEGLQQRTADDQADPPKDLPF